MSFMPNNLNEMIKRSGLTKKECGEAMPNGGLTPETVSRHISGKIGLTLGLAEDYAEVLQCSAFEVMFEAIPTPIIGHCHIDVEGHVSREIYSSKMQQLDLCDKVYSHTHLPYNSAILEWSVDKAYTGPWQYWFRALEYIMLDPILEKYVSDDCIQRESFCFLEEPYTDSLGNKTHLVAGMLYPEPGGVYQIQNGDLNYHLKNQKLVWATPSIGVTHRPKLRGMTVVRAKYNDK